MCERRFGGNGFAQGVILLLLIACSAGGSSIELLLFNSQLLPVLARPFL